MSSRLDNQRVIRAPHGPELSCKSWLAEAPMRRGRHKNIPL